MSDMKNNDPLKELLPENDSTKVKVTKKINTIHYWVGVACIFIWLILTLSECMA